LRWRVHHRSDLAVSPATGPLTWTFAVVPDTNLQTFQTTIRSQHPWLPITATVSSAITPSSTPPARISTQGSYTSPRGCTGTLLSVGSAEAARIEADFSGVDCPSLARSTFTGHVTLGRDLFEVLRDRPNQAACGTHRLDC
jgi:hypothetical protein